nr:hypothetical protein CFP56_15387 [Quercus suber]
MFLLHLVKTAKSVLLIGAWILRASPSVLLGSSGSGEIGTWVRWGLVNQRLGSFAVFARRSCSSAPGFVCSSAPGFSCRMGFFSRRRLGSFAVFARWCCSSAPGFFYRMGFFNTTEVNCVEFVVLVANPRPPLTQNCVVPASPYYQVLGNQSQIGPLMQNCMAPRAAPQFQTRYPVQNHVNYAHQGSYGSVGPIGIKQRNGMLNQAIKGISESLGLTLVQGLLGGGGGSNGVMNTSGGDASASEGGIFWGSIRIWRRRMKSMRSKE